MKDYNSIEEFVFINKKYPSVDQSRLLYDMLWQKYIDNICDEEKKKATANDKLQDYTNGQKHDQKEIVKVISKSAEKLRRLLKNSKKVISVYYSERWGIYSIYVVVNSLSRKKIYTFRDAVPNFFEGWEVKLVTATILQKLRKFLRWVMGSCPMGTGFLNYRKW